MLRMLTDQARSKSELVAENARYASATHHSVPTGETTRLCQNGSDAPSASGQDGSSMQASAFHRSARDAPPLASPGIQALLEIQVQRSLCQTKDLTRDHLLDQGDGNQQSTVGRAERIRGELLKLGLHVSKRTIQKYMRSVRTARPGGQK